MILMNCSQVTRKHLLVKSEETGNENVGSRDYNEDNEYHEAYSEENKLVTETGL